MEIQNNRMVSDLCRNIIGSEIRVMFERADAMEDVISFAIGEPDFTTPKHIIDVAVDKLQNGATHYAPNPGIPELRSAIADTYNEKYGTSLAAQNVVVTNGAMEAVLVAIRALLNPGDEILVPTPHFVAYNGQFQVAGVTPIFVPTYEKNAYQIDLDHMESLITPRCRTVLINTPRNPTGSVFNRETMEGIVDMARRHHLTVISDEIYGDIVYDEPHNCILDFMDLEENVILCNGFSKSYAMTGWRIGYTISTPEIAVSIRRIHEYGSSSTNVALQHGAIEALRNGAQDIEAMRQEYQRRRDLMVRLINDVDGLSCITPKGAFYIFMNIKETGLTSRVFADRLLDEYHTIVVPGTAFGEEGEGYVRLSYAASEETLKEGMKRIARFVASLKK